MAAKGYTTRQKVENYLLTTIDASIYDQITDWIEEVEANIEKITGRIFVADDEDSDRVYDGDNTDMLLIDDAVSVTTVEVDGAKIDATDLKFEPANAAVRGKPITAIVYDGGVFTKGKQNVTVTAKWGYSTECPKDIQRAATILVAGIVNYAYKGEGQVQSMSIGRYQVTYKDEKGWQDFALVDKLLAGYVRHTF